MPDDEGQAWDPRNMRIQIDDAFLLHNDHWA